MALKEQDEESEFADQQGLNVMYAQESSILALYLELNDPHLIDVLIRFQKGVKLCFIFRWAKEGNLRDFWSKKSHGAPAPSTIIWVLNQLTGLSNAIARLHKLPPKDENTDQDLHCRHGDLKPENILNFEPMSPSDLGHLVIGDVGLSKVHLDSTFNRDAAGHIKSRTMSGTQRYEPPNVLDDQARSRSYDIWSMGCVCLEFIIWLLYKNEGLEDFNDRFKKDKFWAAPSNASSSDQAYIHPEVDNWMFWMRESDPRVQKGTALGDLLDLVRDRLLVIKIDITRNENRTAEYRALSHDLLRTMTNIRDHAEPGTHYLDTCAKAQPGLSGPPISESPPLQQRRRRPGPTNLAAPGPRPPRLLPNRNRPEEDGASYFGEGDTVLEVPTLVNCVPGHSIAQANVN
jgi:serine/threonine protein kinase